jgi:hypothetical protein
MNEQRTNAKLRRARFTITRFLRKMADGNGRRARAPNDCAGNENSPRGIGDSRLQSRVRASVYAGIVRPGVAGRNEIAAPFLGKCEQPVPISVPQNGWAFRECSG